MCSHCNVLWLQDIRHIENSTLNEDKALTEERNNEADRTRSPHSLLLLHDILQRQKRRKNKLEVVHQENFKRRVQSSSHSLYTNAVGQNETTPWV